MRLPLPSLQLYRKICDPALVMADLRQDQAIQLEGKSENESVVVAQQLRGRRVHRHQVRLGGRVHRLLQPHRQLQEAPPLLVQHQSLAARLCHWGTDVLRALS